MSTARDLRKQLVDVALEWEKHFGVAPSITSAISELGAARLVGMSREKAAFRLGSVNLDSQNPRGTGIYSG